MFYLQWLKPLEFFINPYAALKRRSSTKTLPSFIAFHATPDECVRGYISKFKNNT
jgi:hypothetical protein